MNNQALNELLAQQLQAHDLNTSLVYPTYSSLPAEVKDRLTQGAFERKVRKIKALLMAGTPLPSRSMGQVVMTVAENTALVEVSETDRVQTLEDLLVEANVDLTVWKVDSYKVNKWEMASKDSAGAVTQTNVVPLYQVKVSLSRIAPTIPIIVPLVLPEYRRIEVPTDSTSSTVLVLADSQIGFARKGGKLVTYHDRAAMDCTLQMARDLQPQIIVVNGDLLDMTEASRFAQKPEFQRTLQPAINELGWFLKELRLACRSARIIYMIGNHEYRLLRSIMENLSFAYDLRAVGDLVPFYSLQKLLALDSIDVELIEDYPSGVVWLSDKLKVVHGEYVKATKVLDTTNDSVIMGHLHRRETVCKTLHFRDRIEVVEAAISGCLCKIDGTVPGVVSRPSWQQGIVVAELFGKNHQINQVAIHEGMAFFRGKVYRGQEYSLSLD